ncbi:hypothetical protein KOW79_021046 [Hemibagrus wyckioides]|uniref:RRM domain-containing protein n=1 Tax=Hemibagrus wyckioides TaxID=337641 RepID=A0A9D3N5T8_9TELE|nr:hypothetical protein KOW79_021046 [Hemibagrus wyckioides]
MVEVFGCKQKRASSESLCDVVCKRLKVNGEHGELQRLQDEDEATPPRLSRPDDQLCDRISVRDVSELLQYITLRKHHDVKKPSWCRLHQEDRVEQVHVAVLEGVAQLHFYTHYTQFKHLRSKYTTRCTLVPSSGDVLSELFDSDLSAVGSSAGSSSALRRVPPTDDVGHHPVVRRYGMKRKGLSSYLLTEQERMKKNFPVKGGRGFESFVCTQADDHVTDRSPLYGLDCEMCLTQEGPELTRVAVVTSSGECLIHPHLIDTSLLYLKEFGQRFKLKLLAQVILKRDIQCEQRRGHDPCEDARAALDLAQYFINNGPRQVVECHLQDLWGVEPFPVTGALNGSVHTHTHTHSSLLFGHALNKAGLPALFLGQSEALNGVSSNHLWRRHYCNSDKESVCVFQRVCQSYTLSLVQFSSLRRNPTGGTHTLQQMALRVNLMCVLFVGPLPHTYTEKDVHTLLKPYGILRSVRLLHSTHKLHAIVEFQHLEGAELALQSLTNLQIEDTMIKLQRPVNELTLDLDTSLAELQNDVQNSHMIYVGRLSRQRRHQLLQAFVSLGPACDLTPAKDSGKRRRHTRIKFVRSDSACAALRSMVQTGNRKLHMCRSLTPAHMLTWTHTNPVTVETTVEPAGLEERTVREEAEPAGLTCAQDGEMQRMMRRLDRNVGKMFRALERHTLSIILLPGFICNGVEYHGLCFIQVKQV